MMVMNDFVGSTVALLYGDEIVATQRSNMPQMRWPGMWEIPGGGREGQESPEECAIREVREELGITLTPEAFEWKKEWPAILDERLKAWFFVAPIEQSEIKQIRLSNEGQAWQMMPVNEFLERADVIAKLKDRLRDYLTRCDQA